MMISPEAAEQLLTACKSVLKNEDCISEVGKMVLILAINKAEPKNETQINNNIEEE